MVNDRDLDMVARNLLLLVKKDPLIAAQNIVHLWYSAFITPTLMNTLKMEIEPLIHAVCAKVEHRCDIALHSKTIETPRGTPRVLLKKQSWNALLDYTKVPDVTVAKAQEVRRAVMLAPSRIDYRERAYFQEDPPMRFGAHKFREQGILLPMGASSEAFTVPNPIPQSRHQGSGNMLTEDGTHSTMFTNSGGWHTMDSADPTNGWRMSRIRKKAGSPAAVNDVFGRLYYHVVELVVDVHKRLPSTKLGVEMMQMDANDLFGHLSPRQTRFDRIETSNIADLAYLNPVGAVSRLGPLLKPPSENPHATLITLFINAVHDIAALSGVDNHTGWMDAAIRKVAKYLPVSPPRHEFDAGVLRMMSIMEMFKDFDGLFAKYIERIEFVPVLHSMGMEMKETHTIVDKWPMRLKKRPDEAGAKEEFQDLCNSQHTGGDRYVEWRIRR
ncbi:trehalose-phosphatase [Apiospora saccharicola]